MIRMAFYLRPCPEMDRWTRLAAWIICRLTCPRGGFQIWHVEAILDDGSRVTATTDQGFTTDPRPEGYRPGQWIEINLPLTVTPEVTEWIAEKRQQAIDSSHSPWWMWLFRRGGYNFLGVLRAWTKGGIPTNRDQEWCSETCAELLCRLGLKGFIEDSTFTPYDVFRTLIGMGYWNVRRNWLGTLMPGTPFNAGVSA